MLNNFTHVSSPNTFNVLLCCISLSTILSVVIFYDRNISKMFVDVNIYDPVVRDSMRCVVIVGLPTMDFFMRVVFGYFWRVCLKNGIRWR